MHTMSFEWEHEPAQERKRDVVEDNVRPAIQPWADAWALKRGTPQQVDVKLTTVAIAWAGTFSVGLRPVQLCEGYPRVANRLALTWQDPVLAKRVLDCLLGDNRGGRKGFPTVVAEELTKLAAHVVFTLRHGAAAIEPSWVPGGRLGGMRPH